MSWLKPSVVSCTLVLLAVGECLADDTAALLRIEGLRVHLAKGGSGWIEVTSIFQGISDEPNTYDILAEYGVTNRKTSIENAGDRRKRVVCRGDFADVLQLVKIIDSGSPFLLSRDKDFEISWNRGLLKLRLVYNDCPADDHASATPTLEVSTEGRFSENTSGEVNQERTRTTIKAARELVLEIKQLGK